MNCNARKSSFQFSSITPDLVFRVLLPNSICKGHRYLIHVNMTAVVELTRTCFLGPMLARHAGWILNVASTASLSTGAVYSNLYYASKAFVCSFLVRVVGGIKRQPGVTATVLCPVFGTDAVAILRPRQHEASTEKTADDDAG